MSNPPDSVAMAAMNVLYAVPGLIFSILVVSILRESLVDTILDTSLRPVEPEPGAGAA